jgi:hypothetical protein
MPIVRYAILVVLSHIIITGVHGIARREDVLEEDWLIWHIQDCCYRNKIIYYPTTKTFFDAKVEDIQL